MRSRLLSVCLIAVAASAPLFGQVQVATPNTYGTTSNTVFTAGAYDFQPVDSSVSFGANLDYRYITAGCCAVAPVHLPNGAIVNAIELEACDSDSTNGLQLSFGVCQKLNAGCTVPAQITTSGNSGCSTVLQNLATPAVIDNNAFHYILEISTGPTVATRFGAARVFYKLQVSPDPATTTFNDVPAGSNFHRFVEALVAAGITAGCGSGNYCPDQPVTRGQMAVFLATALGLHFPN